ncbi:hypothetical protein DFH07DRAFT_823986 [Mycena maculata]|uniref:G domain-containing protein n=1 Tax=Mycena maculata TaxID=230809 RepID=A0AAD7J3L6_9AGAR|nr:hypothetical protein DFH07DRAFT_823986 [Mycena maculata]
MHPDLPVPQRSVQETLAICERFRIVCVGRTGAGKSRLINHVFQVDDAKVSNYKPGEANIYSEFTSETNPRFVLHDSQGFEPVSESTFDVVRDFIIQKSDKKLKLPERLHAVWLCIKTPIAGARVLEIGDEKLLQLGEECKVPVVVVFTQYDKLIRKHIATKEKTIKDQKELREWSNNQATKDFERCVASLENAVTRLKLSMMPNYMNVSVTANYTGNISPLVEMTRELVEKHQRSEEADLWVVWATAQQVDLPLKMEACVGKGMNYYWRALSGALPLAGNALLRDALVRVHEDIIACWNFKDAKAVLTSDEFKHLMVYVVQDMKDGHPKSSLPEIDKINQFVSLCTAATASFAPPAAILGLTFLFVKWLSDAALENASEVHRVLLAYIMDLILVMEELFKIALQPKVFGRISWTELEEAFEAYGRTGSPVKIHEGIRMLVEQDAGLEGKVATIRRGVENLLQQHR